MRQFFVAGWLSFNHFLLRKPFGGVEEVRKTIHFSQMVSSVRVYFVASQPDPDVNQGTSFPSSCGLSYGVSTFVGK